MMQKDKVEVTSWTDDLEYINEELEYLIDIEDRILNNVHLYQQLHELKNENQSRIKTLQRYGSNMRHIIECDTAQCDAFYLQKHEKNRIVYLEHIKNYRRIKTKVLSQILLNIKV
ncbi:hypothetical protein D9O36_16555 [Zobellia amurskyensis]|uniref:Uncharacterized protein n=2 Tax=Zobellia amurskyensis TaxID=248905 RepID=A0A7X2ZW17_9FLAO|nr:hypothetical protein [Zobellia amurskyensis]